MAGIKSSSTTRLIIIAVLTLFLLHIVVPSASVQSIYGKNVTFLGSPSSTSGDSPASHSGYGMDCNGYSPIYSNAPWHTICSDPVAPQGTSWDGKYYDNGHYIGHDEPDVQFYSSAPKSGYNFQWEITLPEDPAIPPTQNGSVTTQAEIGIFWLSLSLCDPWSFPFNPCTPDSNSNIGGGVNYPYGPPGAAGAAHLELQFYPPYLDQCSGRWCVGMEIDSFEPGPNSSNCGEPNNGAYIQMNGIPTGPPGPGEQTSATHTINSETLLMNGGDELLVTMKDTTAGLYVGIQDLNTGESGYMVASAANGFLHTDAADCATAPFSFHPEFATAAPGNVNPWTGNGDDVSLAFEIGHFELGTNGDGDFDEVYCSVLQSVVHYCSGDGGGASNADTDFDSLSYNASAYSNGSPMHPTSIVINNPGESGAGPASWDGNAYVTPYDIIRFTAIIGSSTPGCSFSTGVGCTVPPGNATFYPYYSLGGSGTSCVMNFGGSILGVTTNTFGEDAEYGTSDPNYHYTIQGQFIPNPCASDLQRLTINYSIPNSKAAAGLTIPLPSLSYISGGQIHNVSLGPTSTVVYADPESQWNLSESQQGLPSGVRLRSVGPTSGNNSAAEDVSLTFYLQAQFRFAYKVDGGGSGYASPEVQYVALGMPNHTSSATVWADLGSIYSYAIQLGGSTTTERWEANQSSVTGEVIGSGIVSPTYYHQYLVSFAATPSGFGTVSPSEFQWYDAGATYPINAIPDSGYLFSGWSSNSSLIVFGAKSYSSTTVTVNGAGTILASFQQNSAITTSSSSTVTTPSSTSGTANPMLGYGIGGGIVAVVIVVGLSILFLRRRRAT